MRIASPSPQPQPQPATATSGPMLSGSRAGALAGDPVAQALALEIESSREHQKAAAVTREIASRTRLAHQLRAIDRLEAAAQKGLGSAILKSLFEIGSVGAQATADAAQARAAGATGAAAAELQKQALATQQAARGAQLLASVINHGEPLQHLLKRDEASKAMAEVRAEAYQRHEQEARDSVQTARQAAQQAAARLQSVSQLQHETRMAALGRM